MTEYAMLIAVVTASLLAMKLFVQRGVQAKLKDMIVAVGLNEQRADEVEVATSNITLYRNSVGETEVSSSERVVARGDSWGYEKESRVSTNTLEN